MQAICKRFFEHCNQHDVGLQHRGNFTLSYATTIPRQAGLSGSSAIVCAALNCLLDFYGVADQCGPTGLPQQGIVNVYTFHVILCRLDMTSALQPANFIRCCQTNWPHSPAHKVSLEGSGSSREVAYGYSGWSSACLTAARTLSRL